MTLAYDGVNKMGEPRRYRVTDNLPPEALAALRQYIDKLEKEAYMKGKTDQYDYDQNKEII